MRMKPFTADFTVLTPNNDAFISSVYINKQRNLSCGVPQDAISDRKMTYIITHP